MDELRGACTALHNPKKKKETHGVRTPLSPEVGPSGRGGGNAPIPSGPVRSDRRSRSELVRHHVVELDGDVFGLRVREDPFRHLRFERLTRDVVTAVGVVHEVVDDFFGLFVRSGDAFGDLADVFVGDRDALFIDELSTKSERRMRRSA